MTICVGFPAISKTNARVLILGSLPGAESLKRHEYYAKKQNSFWRMMGDLVGAMPTLPYEERLRQLTKHGFALWDVCASAYRTGSLDSNIQLSTLIPNDLATFLKIHNRINLVCFNGQSAEKLFLKKVLPTLSPDMVSLRRRVLPSTSPAHAKMAYQDKILMWRKALEEYIP